MVARSYKAVQFALEFQAVVKVQPCERYDGHRHYRPIRYTVGEIAGMGFCVGFDSEEYCNAQKAYQQEI